MTNDDTVSLKEKDDIESKLNGHKLQLARILSKDHIYWDRCKFIHINAVLDFSGISSGMFSKISQKRLCVFSTGENYGFDFRNKCLYLNSDITYKKDEITSH